MSDLRKARSWWHDEARQMKREGATIKEIMAKFDRSEFAVCCATKGVPAKHGNRRNVGDVAGYKIGSQKRVAVSFSEAQVSAINVLAADQGVSFSLAVARLVDAALSRKTLEVETC